MRTVGPAAVQVHEGAAYLPELADRVRRGTPQPGVHQSAWPALSLIRADVTADHLPTVYEPCLCVVVQGSKQALLENERFEYNPGHFLVVSMTLPVIARITAASAEQPYLCLRLTIDPAELAKLLLSLPEAACPLPSSSRGLYLAPMSTPLADALLRLLRALEKPAELAIMGPLLMREIYYRVLTGGLGQRLRELVDSASHARRIAHAIELIKQSFDQPLSVINLAEQLHVSTSTLHHRFKQLTAMTPLQFQKHLRLHEARRLMLADGLGAANAGHRVGYGSPSQFSRDYRRLFGAPPRRALRSIAVDAA